MRKKIKFNNLNHLNNMIKKKLLLSFEKHIEKSNFIGGKEVLKFEKNFAKINNSKFCVSCANGSDALLIALKALGVKKGDEVITTSFSWIATSAAITMAGAKVIFCDTNQDDFNIDPREIEKKITKKTVGIIPVHLYGYPADMINIMKLSKRYKLWVVEDCAQAHLAKIGKKNVGNFGKFGTFSFFPGKNLGALGDAGCLVSNDKSLSFKARLIANHGGKGLHLMEGVNSRMDSIQASFLNIKLKFLRKETKKRINNAKIYQKKLKVIKQILLPNLKKNYFRTYHQFVIRSKFRDKLKKYLLKKGIETQIHYTQILPKMKAYNYLNIRDKFMNSQKLSKEILCLPISAEKSKSEINYIINHIIKFFNIDLKI